MPRELCFLTPIKGAVLPKPGHWFRVTEGRFIYAKEYEMAGLAICGLILIRGGPGTVAARDGTTPNPQARPRRIGGRIGVWEQHPILSCQAPAHDHVELNPVT